MIIKNLKANNFGILKNVDIDFNQSGFNLIVGEVGQGKSQIYEVIAKLLINYNGKGKNENLLNKDPSCTEYFISIELSHAGKDFYIEETFNGNASKKLVIDEGRPYINSEATEKLKEIFDPVFCKAGLISFQNGNDLVSCTDGDRLKLLKSLYDLDFSKEEKFIKEEIDKIQSDNLKEVEDQILILKNKDYDKKETKVIPHKPNESIIEEIEKKLSIIQKEKSRIEDNKIKLKDLQLEIQNKDKKIVRNNEKIVSLQNECDIEEIENKITVCEKEIENFQKDLSKLNDIEIVIPRKQIIDRNLLDQYKNEKVQVKSNIQECEKEIKRLKEGKCPTCNRLYNDNDKLEELEKNLPTLYIALSKVEEEIENELEIIKVIEEKNNEREKLLQEKNEHDKKLERCKNNINQKENNIKAYKKDIELINEKLNRIEELKKDNEDLHITKIKLNDEINKIKNDVSYDNTEENELLINKKDYQNSLKNYNDVIQYNTFVKNHNEKIDKSKVEDEIKLKDLLKKQDDILDLIKNYKEARGILQKDFPTYVLQSIKDNLVDGINDYVDVVYDGRYHTDLNLQDKGVKFTYGKHDMDVRLLSSGGESDIFNTGFKNAFSKIANLKVLLLDEIDRYFSETRSEVVFNFFKNKLDEGIFNQIFVITHKEILKDFISESGNSSTFLVEKGVITNIA